MELINRPVIIDGGGRVDLLGDCWVTGRPVMQPASQLTPDTANHHASLSPPTTTTTTTSRTTTPKRPRIFTRHHAAVFMPARCSLRLPIVYTVGPRRRSIVITVLSSPPGILP